LNEDAFRVGPDVVCEGRDGAVSGRARYGHPFVAAVADGMGGHEHGELASAMVVRCLDHTVWASEPSPSNRIRKELESAHLSLCAMGTGDGRSPGSTVVGIYHDGDDFFCFHAGDSRLYRLREGRLAQLTTDHTMQARYGGAYNRNVLYNCVGGGSLDLKVVMNNLPPMASTDDLLVMVSDGLYDGLTETMLQDALQSGSGAEDLVALAIAAGSQDNVTVLTLRVDDTD
jgi:protein phosphatase